MANSILEFPIKHIEDNLVFGNDGTVWAYYKIEGFGYDFLESDEKVVPFQRQLAFLSNIEEDIHYLVVPSPTDVGGILDRTIENMQLLNYPLKEYGVSFMEQTKQVLVEQTRTDETSEYFHYFGIQLNPMKNKYRSENAGINILSSLKHFFEGLNSPVYKTLGLEPYDILIEEITAYRNQADSIIASIGGAFSSIVKKVSAEELAYITEKTFSTTMANSDVKIRNDFVSGVLVEGVGDEGEKHKAVRPTEKTFISLQGTHVEEIGPKTLLLSKIIDNEVLEIYTQFVICHSMESENYHPGFEWLYHIQSRMPFPITVSVRAYHQNNESIRKKLSNALLEFEDQRKEASKGGSSTDLSVIDSERGAIQMESYFKKSGQPAYSCSFVFKITANDEKTLKTRVDLLVNEMSRFGIKVISPYGEQINLMMETLPASKQYNNDYKIDVAPGVLAGMLFGATTNIGDNRGFYIGKTKQFKKPVFIQPDLAGKAFEGMANIVNSISVLVAGMTGKGKSFFMNLFVFLSTLTGSQGLIIDPKGDRRGWVNGLPYIPKEFISVWTLGTSDEDAGCLDPFRTSKRIENGVNVGLDDGKDITMDILSYLSNVKIEDDGYSLLSEAVEVVSKTDDPCIGAIITYLQDLHESRPENMSDMRYESVEKLKGTLETLNRNQLAKLLFGQVGQNYKTLQVDKPIQVLMVQNLSLPSESVRELRPAHKISEAIMISITAFTKQYMFTQDRTKHKFILQDEASSIERSSVGSELLDFIVRQGRYYNTTLLKGSQNASDHGEDVANMGMKFSFGLRKTSEAQEMLDYLNLPQTTNNIETLKNLGLGEALFQDIFGRSAVVRIDPVFRDLLNAFDSSTSTEEEKERERQRISV